VNQKTLEPFDLCSTRTKQLIRVNFGTSICQTMIVSKHMHVVSAKRNTSSEIPFQVARGSQLIGTIDDVETFIDSGPGLSLMTRTITRDQLYRPTPTSACPAARAETGKETVPRKRVIGAGGWFNCQYRCDSEMEVSLSWKHRAVPDQLLSKPRAVAESIGSAPGSVCAESTRNGLEWLFRP
jgi:hypothetical protein